LTVPDPEKAWSILQSPRQVENYDSLQYTMNDLGISTSNDLLNCTEEGLVAIGNCLKRIPSKKFKIVLLLTTKD
jgi:hypothetical protein